MRLDHVIYGTRDLEETAADTSSAGSHSFTVTGTDLAGNVTVKTVQYTVVYTWNGFFKPVTNSSSSKLNLVHAGDLVKVGFGLNGNRGLGVGTFSSSAVSCPSWAPRSVKAAGAGSTVGLSYVWLRVITRMGGRRLLAGRVRVVGSRCS